ncbi:MAG: alpha/beta hydrolase [Parvularcula sp.]
MTPITIDPEIFRPERIDPATAQRNAEIEFLLSSAPGPWDVGAEAIRAARKSGDGLFKYQPHDPDAAWHTARALGKEVPIRIFEPSQSPTGVLLHIHGGGHTLGAADAQDGRLRDLSNRQGMVVASVEYRLAPEHPFPAAPDDCEAAALWLAQEAKALFGTDRLFAMGESAGANLVAVTMIRLQHLHHIMPFSGVSLQYGQFDLAGLPAAKSWGERNLIINTPIIQWFNQNYVPKDTFTDEDRNAPEISPINANLTGLCPAHFICGTLDPLIDDTLLMAARWGAAGNEVKLDLYPGAVHGFNMIEGYPISDAANQDIEDWLLRDQQDPLRS